MRKFHSNIHFFSNVDKLFVARARMFLAVASKIGISSTAISDWERDVNSLLTYAKGIIPIRCESTRPTAKQMMDAAAINRLFLSKRPRIPVIVTAQVVKIFFISADQSMNLAKGAIIRF